MLKLCLKAQFIIKKFKHKKERKLYQASFSPISTPYSYPYDIKKKSTITISLFFLFPFVRLLGRWAIANPLNLKFSFSAHTASVLNTCHQREPHPDSVDGKDLLTTRLCMLNTCQDCYSKHQSDYDEACKNEKKEAGNPDWESYKCCRRLIPRSVPFQNYHHDVIIVFGVDTKSLSPRCMYWIY